MEGREPLLQKEDEKKRRKGRESSAWGSHKENTLLRPLTGELRGTHYGNFFANNGAQILRFQKAAPFARVKPGRQ